MSLKNDKSIIKKIEWTGPRFTFPSLKPGDELYDYAKSNPFYNQGRAILGDTYPMTWAADGNTYVSCGDSNWGKKFDGLDIERFEGDPLNYKIKKVNEMRGYTGGGGDGVKPCGMISVKGVLYLAFQNLLRNKPPVYGSCSQHGSDAMIVSSRDFGKTWTPDIKKIKEPMFPGSAFGGPAFINSGKDNKNARDNYVYAVSGDQWDNGSNLRLGRVPKDKIASRESWEFVTGITRDNRAEWSRDLKKAVSVLFSDRKISLPDMVYIAPLKRYLLLTWSLHLDFDPDFGSALYIYESPEPWGPFTLVHYEKMWEEKVVNPYCPRIPLKWMSKDGLNGWLQFSGNWAPNSQYYRSHIRPFKITLNKGR